MKKKPLVIVILGPTASGKSEWAVRLAKKFNGEVISADSRQVYRGLDIGSGKVEKDSNLSESCKLIADSYCHRGIPHHLLDVADPREQFTVADYKKLAAAKIEEISARGKMPILCGGTGLYIKAVVDNLALPAVPPNPPLRAALAKLSTADLFARIRELDPARAATIDRHNPRRLIRAIEISEAGGGEVESSSDFAFPGDDRSKAELLSAEPYNFLQIGIRVAPEELREKIRIRLFARIREQGMIEEAALLYNNGVPWKRLEELGLEYRYVARYLQNQISREELGEQLELAIWHYAKRQMTWFKRDHRIVWLENYEAAETLVAGAQIGQA